MKWRILSLAAMMVCVSIARADYLLLQYMIVEEKPLPKDAPPNQPKEKVVHILQAAVEVKGDFREVPNFQTQSSKIVVKHKYGATTVFADETLLARQIKARTVQQRYAIEKEKLAAARNPAKEYSFAEWCLQYGLVDEFAAHMDEIAKTGKKTGEDSLDRAVECYTQVKAALAKPLDKEDNGKYWRGRLNFRETDSKQGHYKLLYNAPLSDPPEVGERLETLERNMRAVYYWFALRGQVLKVPDQKLVAVLLDQPDEFRLQQEIDDSPLVNDGFFVPRDNIVVFSKHRLDTPSALFRNYMQGLYQQGWVRADLLAGKGATKSSGKTPAEVAKASTLALLEKALEDESAHASVSHHGTRQILVAAGWQRPNVVMPEWVEFGVASVLETPKSPYLGPVETRSPYWFGYGGPNWAYTRLYKHFANEFARTEEDGLPIKADFTFGATAQLMASIVTDKDFARGHAPGPQGQLALLQARTHSWALCYYLLKKRPAGVKNLYDQLAKMPRDMEPEPGDLMACFCRAFDVADTTGTKMDPVKFNALAEDWKGFMNTVLPPGTEINLGAPSGTAPPGAGGPAGGGGGANKGG